MLVTSKRLRQITLKPQVVRIKTVKTIFLPYHLRLASSSHVQNKSEKKTAGRVEGRSTNIEMMSRLTSVIEERRKEREIKKS